MINRRTTKKGIYHADFYYNDPVTGTVKRCRRSTRTSNSAEARTIARRWLIELQTPPEPEPELVKVASFSNFAAYWLKMKAPDWTSTTWRTAEYITRVHLVPHFGGFQNLRGIGREEVQSFKLAQLNAGKVKQRGYSPKSINNRLGVLSALFRDAATWGYAESNPSLGVGKVRSAPQEMAFWTAEQSERFLAHVRQHRTRWHALYLMALRTGLRSGELFALTWSDLDLNHGVVHVRRALTRKGLELPKHGKTRRVPMSPQLVEVLRAHPRLLNSDLVFYSRRGRGLSSEGIRKTWLRAVAEVDVPRLTFHGLRHSCASQLVMNGKPLSAVQEVLGHANISTTRRYAHLAPAHLAEAVASLDPRPHEEAEIGPRTQFGQATG